ncbi:MAG: cupin domain-containing protein [Demequinaceae bacterium]|nr:cupin domain-containing protein [Demequinaceae bacterium]
MLGWVKNIEKISLKNKNFRKVVFTGKHAQVVLMRLAPGEEIGWEAHPKVDQFFRLEQGKVRLDLGTKNGVADESHEAKDAWAFVVPAGVFHNVTNVGEKVVKLYTIYSPPNHPAGTIHKTKAEADAAEDHS